MYGEVVDGIDGHRFEQALADLKRERGAQQDVDLSADDLASLLETFKGIYKQETGDEFPQDAREQLRRAVVAVFESWQNPRAQVYRRTYDIPDDIGTAVNVVQMVFGNKGDRSATGVCFTRDPSTGETGLYGEYLVNAQGEDVVPACARRSRIEEMRAAAAGRVRPAARNDDAARAALPRHAGHRVHGRGGQALPPADALGEAHRRCGAEGGGRHDGEGLDLARRGDRAHRSRRSSISCSIR